MNYRIDIVVVTHNSRAVVDGCLESLSGIEAGLRLRTFLVDSASTDGTADYVRMAHPAVNVIDMGRNRGFAAGCNTGISAGTSPLVLLLNPDAAIARADLRRLAQYLYGHPTAAAVGPAIVNQAGQPDFGRQRLPSPMGELARTWERAARPLGVRRDDERSGSTGDALWISGACMLIKRSALQSIGRLDEGFFLYYEETDWCRRAQANGWGIHHLEAATCMHVGGAGSGPVTPASLRLSRARFRASRRRYFRKHFGISAMLAVESLHALGFARRAWIRGSVVACLTVSGTPA